MRQTIKKASLSTCNAQVPPDHRLAGLVAYWKVVSDGKLPRSNLVFTADEHVDMMFDFNSAGLKRVPYLSGIHLGPREYMVSGLVEVIGVKFLPGSFYSLFHVSADSAGGKFLPLKSVIGQDAECFKDVLAQKSFKTKIRAIDAALLKFVKGREQVDPRISRAVGEVYAHNGNISVEALANTAGLTRCWFFEAFKKWVGVNPRLFCGHVRFMAAVRALGAGKKMPDVISELGYADQAHFIRSVKRRTGIPPQKFLKQYVYML